MKWVSRQKLLAPCNNSGPIFFLHTDRRDCVDMPRAFLLFLQKGLQGRGQAKGSNSTVKKNTSAALS